MILLPAKFTIHLTFKVSFIDLKKKPTVIIVSLPDSATSNEEKNIMFNSRP